jgi:hypothetical protein
MIKKLAADVLKGLEDIILILVFFYRKCHKKSPLCCAGHAVGGSCEKACG